MQHKAPRAASLLTPREGEVLRLISSGMSSKAIAASLGISFKTVITHRTRLMEKLDLHNVADVTRYAYGSMSRCPTASRSNPTANCSISCRR